MEPKNDILTLCMKSIDSAQHLTSAENLDLQINSQQCKLLARKLCGIRATLDKVREILSEEASADAADRWLQIMKEIYRVLKASEALIKDCCCQDRWLKAAIRQGDKKQDFAELLYDVEWCTSILCDAYFNRTGHSETHHVDQYARLCECKSKLSVTDCFTLEAAAKKDRDSLKASLKLLKEDHVCEESCKLLICQAAQYCLAAQLLEKLQAQALPNDGLIEVSTSPLVLWANAGELSKGAKLGEGSMGKVYETMWQGEKYAKKKFSSNISLFEEEVAALARLDHPHIIRLVCCCKSERDVLLMELMDKDLFALLRDQSAPFFNLQAVDLMLQIAEGMRYLHAKHIAHRDLKSLNILVRFVDISTSLGEDVYLHAKIGDFGLSKTKNASTRYSKQTLDIGSRQWKAPEVFSVHDEEDPPTRFHPLKTDVYSFGIICAEILTGEEPFVKNLFDLRRRVKKGERPQLPESCPTKLAFLVKKCWDGDPLKRPDFVKICKELRYIKELLLKDERVQLERLDAYTFHTKAIEVQGPWGGPGGSPFFDGVSTSIRGFELKFDKQPPCIWSIKMKYDVNGTTFQGLEHGLFNRGQNFAEVSFLPNEFLEHIEGSFGFVPYYYGSFQFTGINSLKFCTNVHTYGPYGDEGDTKFMTNPGCRVVGLFGSCGDLLDNLGAFVVPNEITRNLM